MYAGRTAAVVGRQLGGAGGPPAAGPRAPALLEALGALAGAPHAPAHLGPAMPALHHMLEQMQRYILYSDFY